MAVKFLDKTGLGYFWGKIKAWCNSTFAAIAHTHTSYAVKHSYTTAANAAKNWYRIANANTSQIDTTKPIHTQFILTAYNASYDTGYYERWFVNAEVFGRTAHIVILGNTSAPFSQARVLYENTIADLDANDRPAIDIYLNSQLANGTTKIEIEEVYNSGWTFVSDGQISASTVPTGFENMACSVRGNGVERSTYADYVTYLNKPRREISTNTTLADNNTYRSTTLNCTGTITITVPSLNNGYAWFFIKNANVSSGVITVHPSTTSVLIDGSNADIKLQPGEYIVIHSRAANSYSIISDGIRYDRCIVSVDNRNNYPFHRIAYIPVVTGSWTDRGITFLVSKDYQGGGYGIARIIFRTNNAASQVAQCSVQWLSRTSDIAVNAIQVGFVKTAGASYLDVFYYSDGTYNSAVCRVLAHANARNGVGRGFTVVSVSTEVGNTTATDPKTSVESYKTIADAGTALHSQAYTDIIVASDAGVVGTAATASAVAWSGVTSKPTTIAGYGITDAKIVNGTITLGSNSITPLTSVPSHNQASNTINAMTGYSKPSSGSAIATSDSLNSAIGKLEAKVDAVDDSNYVHKTGDETVAGAKTFTAASIPVKNANAEKGAEGSGEKYLNVNFIDKNNLSVGQVLARALSNGGTTVGLFCYDPTSSGNVPNTQLAIWWLKDADPYAIAPSTPTGMGGNAIVTSDFIPRDTRIVHTTGNEVISGGKLFTGDMDIQSTAHAKGEAPANDAFYNFWVCDKNATAGNTPTSTRFGGLELILYQDKTISTNLVSYVNNTNSSNSTVVGAISHADGNDGYGFVRNGYFQTYDSNGYIVNANFEKGSVPSYSFYHMLLKLRDSNKKNVGGLYHYYLTNKENYVSLIVYNGTNGTDTSSDQEQIGVGYKSNGRVFTYAPTPDSSSNDTNIATTAFVKAQDYVTRTTAQTITGTKTFSADIISNTGVFAKKPNNNSYLQLFGGADSLSTTGGKLFLGGSSASLQTSMGILQGGDSTGYRQLIVTPNRIKFNTDYCLFPANHATVGFMTEEKANGRFVIYSGGHEFDGAGIKLHGRTYSGYEGKFNVYASTKSSDSDTNGSLRTLTGTPDGSIYWDGQPLQVSSDERLKTEFSSVDNNILDNWEKVDWLQFKYKDAVQEKGKNARFHIGLVAQRVDKVFIDANADIKKYGIICYEHEESGYREETVIDAEAYTDTDGVFHEEVSHTSREFVPGRDEWTVRYTEALCMEAAYMRRENARLKKRVADLEERLAALELKIS